MPRKSSDSQEAARRIAEELRQKRLDHEARLEKLKHDGVVLNVIDIPKPAEAVDAELKRRAGAAIKNLDRRQEAVDNAAYYRQLAAAIQEQNPTWKPTRIAQQIHDDLVKEGFKVDKPDTIRKKI